MIVSFDHLYAKLTEELEDTRADKNHSNACGDNEDFYYHSGRVDALEEVLGMLGHP